MKKFLSLVLIFLGVKVYSQSQAICSGSSGTITANVTSTSTLVTPSGTFGPAQNTLTTLFQFVVSPTITTSYTLLSPPSPSAIVVVTVNPRPVVAPTYTQATCTNSLSGFNFHLTFSPTNPVPTYTVTWAPDPGLTSTIPVVPACITAPTDYSCFGSNFSGGYQASITAAGGCQVVVSFTLLAQPAQAIYSLIPSASVYSITCAQPNPTISVNNTNLTYTWTSNTFTTPPNTMTITPTTANAGTVVVVGTNTNSGCTSSRTITIGVNTVVPTGIMTPTNIAVSCTTSIVPDVTLTVTQPTVNFTHRIIPPSLSAWTSNLGTALYQVSNPGTYSYALVNDENGCALNRIINVTSTNTYPTYTLASPQNFSLGCSTKSVASVVFANPQGGQPGASLSYTFIPPGGNSNIVGPYSGIPSTTLTTAGQWTVICFELGSNCQTKATMTIIQNTVAPTLDTVLFTRGKTIDVGGKICGVLTCDSNQVILQAMSETPNISYAWAYGSSPIQNLTSPTVAVTATTALTSLTVANVAYSLTLRDLGNFCQVSSTYTVYHNVAKPTASFSPQNGGLNYLNCLKTELALTNQSKTNISPFFNPRNIVVGDVWLGPSPQVSLTSSSSYTAGVVGIYTMTGKDLDNGCTSTFTLEILGDYLKPSFVTPTGFKLDCGAIETLTAALSLTVPEQTDKSTFTYTWTAPVILPGSINTNTFFIPKSIGAYTVLVTNQKNGCSQPSVMTVGPATLTGLVDISTTSGFAPLEVNLFNNSFSGSNVTGGINSFWNFGNGTGSVIASPGSPSTSAVVSNSVTTKFKLPGVYTIKVNIYKGQCRDSVTKVVIVDVPSTLDIPNVFTPNGDGINDLYFLKTSSLTKISMSIFDRWGRLIFEVKESTTGNIAWDGTNPSGKEAPDGTYFYFLNATGKDGKEFSSKGNITLSR